MTYLDIAYYNVLLFSCYEIEYKTYASSISAKMNRQIINNGQNPTDN